MNRSCDTHRVHRIIIMKSASSPSPRNDEFQQDKSVYASP
jgi:hypothetical protein